MSERTYLEGNGGVVELELAEGLAQQLELVGVHGEEPCDVDGVCKKKKCENNKARLLQVVKNDGNKNAPA